MKGCRRSEREREPGEGCGVGGGAMWWECGVMGWKEAVMRWKMGSQGGSYRSEGRGNEEEDEAEV